MTAFLGALLLAGCDSRPHAPALIDEPVYLNTREGFRFRVPEGWKQFAKADVPPGRVDKERLLVAYRFVTAGASAQMDVALADVSEATDLGLYLSSHVSGGEKWLPASGPELLEVNGVPAVRYTYTGRAGKDKMTKEVVAFRRGERVYFFTGTFRAGDERARGAFREAVDSVIWKS